MQIEKVRYLTVDDEHDGQRLDNFLFRLYRRIPKARIYRAIRKGEIRIDKKRAKPESRLTAGQTIRIPPITAPEKQTITVTHADKQNIKQSILFEDDELIVFDKPSGVAVHGGSGVNYGVIESLRQCYPEHQYMELIHRLDRDTSGILLIAKKAKILRECHRLLRENKVKKQYCVLVAGHWPESLNEVNEPLKKNILVSNERIVTVDPAGKPSLTKFAVIARYGQLATLLKATLVTGRTHQIRVHTAHHQHPVIGDEKYGELAVNNRFKSLGLNRLFLHAESVKFTMVDHPAYQFHADLPGDLQDLLVKLTNK